MKRPTFPIFLLILLFTPIFCSSLSAQPFVSRWHEEPDRQWPGAEFNANRFQDWRLADGRLECLEGRPRSPVRTVILLTREIDPARGSLVSEISVSPTDGGKERGDGWAGILLGIGGPEIDFRIRALVHDKPATDGGVLAVVSATGIVSFRDFTSGGGGGSWAISGALKKDQCAQLPGQVMTGLGIDCDGGEVVRLRLTIEPEDAGTYLLILTARADNEVVSTATLGGFSLDQVDGSIGLVSHLGPKQSQKGHAFVHWTIAGPASVAYPERAFGPVLGVQYSLSRLAPGPLTWKLTAQLPPISADELVAARLEVEDIDGNWRTVARGDFEPLSRTVPFRVEAWQADGETPFRVALDLAQRTGALTTHHYQGSVPAEPTDPDGTFVIGLISCVKNFTGNLQWNRNSIWFPHSEVAAGVAACEPDLIYSAGDQIYEGDITPAVGGPPDVMLLDYQTKWVRWLWAFGELTRRIPTLTVPDDHDVYHGNIWGAGGKHAQRSEGTTAQDAGGYKLAPREVNAIHRTLTSHLPDPLISGPIGDGYSVYATRIEYGGVSMALLSDRQFKSAPRPTVPEGNVVNGWFRNPDFDPRNADVAGAELLGPTQERLLDEWATDWRCGAWMKILLSQTPFNNIATLPPGKSGGVTQSLPIIEVGGYAEGENPVADCDSGGWPQTPRNRAIRSMRKGMAFHLAGDQHLGSLTRYGLDRFGDGGVVFAGPAVANTWPRRWFPSEVGANRAEGWPRYTGDYFDGFGNRMTVLAVSNPTKTGHQPERLYDRGPGWGVIELERSTRKITFEAWPRWSVVGDPSARQYPGWPQTFDQLSMAGIASDWQLAAISARAIARNGGPKEPVVRVIDAASGEVISAYRLRGGETWRPGVPAPGEYLVEIGDGDGSWQRRPIERVD